MRKEGRRKQREVFFVMMGGGPKSFSVIEKFGNQERQERCCFLASFVSVEGVATWRWWC